MVETLIIDNFAGGGGASTGIERMLTPRELFNAQGFPESYVIDHDINGAPITKTAQVAKCGNSVCPPLAEALVRANHPEAIELTKREAA